MRTKLAVVLCAAALLMIFSPAVFAGQEGKFGVGARVGYALYQDDKIDNTDVEFDGTVSFGVDGTYWFSDMFSLELALEYAKPATDLKGDGEKLDFGDLQQLPILLTVRFHPFSAEGFSPYIGVGAGYYLNDFSADNAVKAEMGELDVDNNAGFHACLGTEFFLNDNMALNLEGRYAFDNTKFKADSGDESDSVDLNAITIKGGFKFYF